MKFEENESQSKQNLVFAQPMNKTVLTYRGMIYPWQCDHMGHMNVMWYAGKFDEASWQIIARLGLTRSYMLERNCMMAAAHQDITYKRELREGDIMTIRSRVLEIGDRKVRFLHEMKNDGTGDLAAVTVVTGVHIDRATRRSCPFPHDLLRRMQASLIDGDRPDNIDITQHITEDAASSNASLSGDWLNSARSIEAEWTAN